MYADQIADALRRDKYAKDVFLGVFSIDKLPNVTHLPASAVVNTDPSHLPGTHWIAFFIDKSSKCSFFDSFGKPPSFYMMDKYLNSECKSIEINKHQLQGLTSETCGFYCIYFIVLMSRGFSLENIVNVFSDKSFSFNDFIVEKIIKKLFF